jgi:hypothetical protein
MFYLANLDLHYTSFTQTPAPIISTTTAQKQSPTSATWMELLDSVQNSRIKFKVYWVRTNTYEIIKGPDGFPPPPIPVGLGSGAREGSRVFIQGPSKVYKLSNIDDLRIIDELLKLMDNPARAWAAHVVIAKMMGSSGLITSVGIISPQEWWETEGKTGKAKQAWIDYLEQVKPTMKWTPLGGHYRYLRPYGVSND